MAKKENLMARIGSWCFLGGVLIALLMGLFSGLNTATAASILILLGLIVGFLNVTGKETTGFLLAAVALVLVSGFGGTTLGQVAKIGPYLAGILSSLLVFIVPATIVVALKAIYNMAND